MKRVLAGISVLLVAAGLMVGFGPAASAQAVGTSVLTESPVTAPGVSTPVAAFVTALYQDFLNRRPGESEVAFWGHRFAVGDSRGSVASAFAGSDEYRLIRIDNAYNSILNRGPDPGGRAFWLDAMHRGIVTTDDIEKSFYASQEFYDRTTANGGWINGLYQHLLGRSASWDEASFWTVAASNYSFAHFDWRAHPSGGDLPLDRDWIVAQIYNALEAARARVSVMYQHYLGRVPDEPGVQFWADYDIRMGDAAVRSGFTNSDEYYALASTRFPGN
ncbi:DUF4214 domain-containing protein [Subtercola sp. PAMC28395]|uniref:DUF4214 domain-containing protein n=1 Tax=Subtercola sp. PAMC28395 TaxID=2846775 RepID=UPI001C0B7BB7|nr:DUF4214 domain-containing protein [Subtercola sp. PAMC28395]QWT24649.1 DUF4214 domain-containing protein [Subtercola sp. PAMC28395]